MRKLLYFHNAFVESGSANLVQVISMCNEFSKQGYKVTVVLNTRNSNPTASIAELQNRYLIEEGVNVRLIKKRLPKRITNNLVGNAFKIVVKEENPNLIFVRDARYFWAASRLKLPTIIEVHNTRLHIGNKLLNNLFLRWVVSGANKPFCIKTVFISEALSTHWKRYNIPANKIIVLHDGFSHNLFLKPVSKIEARNELSIDPNINVVVYSGNLQANRGINYIIDIAAALPDTLFVLVGGDDDRKIYYENLCKDNNISNVRFDGFQPHKKIPLYLFSADVLLAMWSKKTPTINYCSPLKLFEYMATGIPMVVPEYPTISEVLEKDKDAFFCTPDNTINMIETMKKAFNADKDYLTKMGETAQSKALKSYTWEARARKIIESLPKHLQP